VVRDPDTLAAVLATQLGFVGAESLRGVMQASSDRALLPRLQEAGLLTPDQRAMVEAMVAGAVQSRGGSFHDTMRTMATSATLPATAARTLAVQTQPGSGNEELEVGWLPEDVTPEAQDRYAVGKELGRGGQARVMVAFDRHIGREVAWKELLSDTEPGSLEPGSAQVTQAAAARFLREARITGRLEHPSIITVHEVGRRENGALYYAMRLVRGTSLDDKLKGCEGLADRMKLLGTFWDVCNAVAYAHSRGVIHRDLKPANIMVAEFGQTVVLDWGLAKVKGTEDPRSNEMAVHTRRMRSASSSDTVAGAAIGTPSYMSPEQAHGSIDELDEQSDVWGAGSRAVRDPHGPSAF
jgi:tRNA A-37 threonylcarbamoyl transferase component Bud32